MKNFRELTPTEKSIRLCWAINNATQISSKLDTADKIRKELPLWADFFLELYEKKMKQLEKVAEDKQNRISDKRELREKHSFESRDLLENSINDFGNL